MPCPCCGYDEVAPDPKEILASIPMSRMQRRIADRLCQSFGRFVTQQELIHAMYWDDDDGGPISADNALSVQLYHLKKRIAPAGLAVVGRDIGTSDGRKLCFRSAA